VRRRARRQALAIKEGAVRRAKIEQVHCTTAMLEHDGVMS
jgi:hypothetical protein